MKTIDIADHIAVPINQPSQTPIMNQDFYYRDNTFSLLFVILSQGFFAIRRQKHSKWQI